MIPLQVNPGWLSLAGIVIAGLFGYLGARLGAKATERKADTDAAIARAAQTSTADTTSGELALKIAKDLRSEVTDLKDWRGRVRTAWAIHEEWDDHILDKLEEMAPGTKASLPPRPPLPID